MNEKIAILIPYFGDKPKWFEYFILSCKKNRGIDWIFFSDCLSTEQKYSNLKFIDMKLNDFNVLATKQLGIKISIKHPYKLCDLKPAYGLIFESFINNYDFWGYGDIDVVYGNILGLLPQNWQLKYDIISNHNEFIPGHLCILRNSDKIKYLFQEAANWHRIFKSSVYHGFDEILHPIKIIPNHLLLTFTKQIKINYHLMASKIISFIMTRMRSIRAQYKKSNFNSSTCILKDFTSIVKWENKQGNLKSYFKTGFMSDLMLRQQGVDCWKIDWDRGILSEKSKGKEIMYFHMILAKNSSRFFIDDYLPQKERFSITKEGIR